MKETIEISDDGDMIGPTSITANENGNYVISDMNAGIYSDFNFIKWLVTFNTNPLFSESKTTKFF